MPQLTEHRVSPGFTTVSLRKGLLPMGHILNVDHFKMSEPTFPPHPHAGFSAVTYMLPWSAGAFVNRDSLGDRSFIRPGDLHWTLAGAGMMHEEIPEVPGTVCEGLQIFVKLREGNELARPRAFHVDAAELPEAREGGSQIRLLVGAWRGLEATIPEQEGTVMMHASVRGAATLEIPPGLDAFAFVLSGSGSINAENVAAGSVSALAPGLVKFSGDNLEVLVGMSEAMPREPRFAGPFCMFDPGELDAAKHRFAAGGMGRLEPSF